MFEEEDTGEYQLILATGLTKVQLDAPITEEYALLALEDEIDTTQPDTDEDGLPDYKEINFSAKNAQGNTMITFTNGVVKLPTYGECTNLKSDLAYVVEGLGRFNNGEINTPLSKVYDYPVLPIVSDPTSEDGDGDGICDFNDHYPLDIEDFNIFKHSITLMPEGYYGCLDCGIKILPPDLQDQSILSDDDYLRVICLKNEFLNSINKRSKTGELSIDDIREYYFSSVYIYQIEDIRSQEEYAKQYDYKGEDGRYYSEFLETVDIDTFKYEYDSNGKLKYTYYFASWVENYEDNKINYLYSYVFVPQAFYLAGFVISFASDPFIAILGSATLSSIPPIANKEYTSADFGWTLLTAAISLKFPSSGIIDKTIKITDIGKTETQFSLSDKIPQEGDKFVYITRGYSCAHEVKPLQRCCNDPGGGNVSTYWFRNGEIVFYEE